MEANRLLVSTGLLLGTFSQCWARVRFMNIKKIITPMVGCSFLVVVAGEGQADTWQKEPSYGIELGYNDNYTLQPEPESADGTDKIQKISTVKATAGLALVQLKPAFNAKIQGKVIATGYSGDVDGYVEKLSGNIDGALLDDRVDGVLEAGFEGRKERAVWRFDAIAASESVLQEVDLSAAVEEAVDTGGTNVNNENGLVREDVTRTRLRLTPSYLYRLSPVSYIRGSVSFNMAQYDNTPNTTLSDYEEQKAQVFYSREFSPVNSWSVDAEYRNYQSDNYGEFDSQVIGLGLLHKFNETTDLGIRVAQSTTSYDAIVATGEESRPLVQVTGSKRTGRTTYSLKAGSELYGSAGGDVVQADELLFNVVYQFSELTTLTWRSKLFQNKSLVELLAAPGNDDERTFNQRIEDANRRYLAFEPTLNWRFSRWWVLDAGLRYQREKRDGKKNAGESNYAFVGITFSKPIGGQEGS